MPALGEVIFSVVFFVHWPCFVTLPPVCLSMGKSVWGSELQLTKDHADIILLIFKVLPRSCVKESYGMLKTDTFIVAEMSMYQNELGQLILRCVFIVSWWKFHGRKLIRERIMSLIHTREKWNGKKGLWDETVVIRKCNVFLKNTFKNPGP